ncbi:MAG: hypothetical protein HQ504_02835 [Rhodospirillaceae bacterium]|nr:hypothetical protein [Rhodospirillaceae bacterium]
MKRNMSQFNNGKAYCGLEAAEYGGLTGATDTDYFYFFCPKCSDKHIMRILEYGIKEESPENSYNSEFKKKAKNGFTLAFKLYCENCKHTDFVKLSNTGRQVGTHSEALEIVSAKKSQ